MNKTASQTLGPKIKQLLKRYRDNRDAQKIGQMWDKQKDVDAIFEAVKEKFPNCRVEASCGAFWVPLPEYKVIQVSAERYWQPKWIKKSRKRIDGGAKVGKINFQNGPVVESIHICLKSKRLRDCRVESVRATTLT